MNSNELSNFNLHSKSWQHGIGPFGKAYAITIELHTHPEEGTIIKLEISTEIAQMPLLAQLFKIDKQYDLLFKNVNKTANELSQTYMGSGDEHYTSLKGILNGIEVEIVIKAKGPDIAKYIGGFEVNEYQDISLVEID